MEIRGIMKDVYGYYNGYILLPTVAEINFSTFVTVVTIPYLWASLRHLVKNCEIMDSINV